MCYAVCLVYARWLNRNRFFTLFACLVLPCHVRCDDLVFHLSLCEQTGTIGSIRLPVCEKKYCSSSIGQFVAQNSFGPKGPILLASHFMNTMNMLCSFFLQISHITKAYTFSTLSSQTDHH